MTSTVYQNELEQQFNRLPGFIQSVLQAPFHWVDGVIKDVAGQPDQLVAAGQAYASLGTQISQLGTEQQQDRTSILSGAYSGKSYDAFSANMAQIEQQISNLGQATGQTQQILDAAAQACTQSASIIVQIVEGTISFILQDVVLSIVTSFFDFGASLAAGAAAAAAKFADACAQIGGVVAKLTPIMEKIAALLGELESICTKVQKYLESVQEVIATQKGLKNLITKQKMVRSGVNVAVRAGAGYGVDGGSIPGPAGAAVHVGIDGYQAGKDAYNGTHP